VVRQRYFSNNNNYYRLYSIESFVFQQEGMQRITNIYTYFFPKNNGSL
jgi:hypothetical protein